jgi:hypothetical protein
LASLSGLGDNLIAHKVGKPAPQLQSDLPLREESEKAMHGRDFREQGNLFVRIFHAQGL